MSGDDLYQDEVKDPPFWLHRLLKILLVYFLVVVFASWIGGDFLGIIVGAVLAVIFCAWKGASFLASLFTGAYSMGPPVEPEPVFGIPEARVADGDFVTARALYDEMLVAFPERLDVWLRVLRFAAESLHDRVYFDQLRIRGKSHLADELPQKALDDFCEALLRDWKPAGASTKLEG